MRSLTFKLIVAFLLTSVLGIGLAAVIARGVTAREFGRFVMGQQRNDLLPGLRLTTRLAVPGRARASISANRMCPRRRIRARRRAPPNSCWRIRTASL